MKIAYIIFHDISRNDGVVKKINSQISVWRKNGHQVTVFCFSKNNGDSISGSKVYPVQRFIHNRLFINSSFKRDFIDFNPDLTYFRYDTVNSNLFFAFKRSKSIAEINTLDVAEYYLLFKYEKSFKAFFRYVIYLFGRSFLLKRVAGLVGVTREIINHKSFSKYNKPSISIPNSINLEKYRIKKSENLTGRVNIFFIGTPKQPWQGEDIIVKWAQELLEYDFHIVGSDGLNSSNLFYHGYLNSNEYLEILSNCHICIGTLGAYKKKISEASPLKVREYLAYGFPTIIGYKDSSFYEESPEFLCQLEKSELYDYSKIRTFVENQKNRIVSRKEINSIDSNFLELQRLEFFEKCLSN